MHEADWTLVDPLTYFKLINTKCQKAISLPHCIKTDTASELESFLLFAFKTIYHKTNLYIKSPDFDWGNAKMLEKKKSF